MSTEKGQHSRAAQARAAAMSPERRTEIARSAAQTRWGVPRETHAGALKFGDVEIECSVLDNGIRVLSTRGVTKAFGGKTTGKAKTGAREMPPILASDKLKPFLTSEITARVVAPVEYSPRRGGRTAFGYEAGLLPDLCKVLIDAGKNGALRRDQEKYAEAAQTIIEGLAKVGIIALVDEATGYQYDRAKDELMRILEAYISKALLPWTRAFPAEFFGEICRLYGWPQVRRVKGRLEGPRYMGKLIKQLVYEQLPEGVLGELENKNPTLPSGYRRYKHFQFLTRDIGNPHLSNQVATVMGLMRASTTKDEFWKLFRRAFPERVKEFSPLVVTPGMQLTFPGFGEPQP